MYAIASRPNSRRSFNPYFSGCFSLSSVFILYRVCVRAVDMFQSLFFWMLLSKSGISSGSWPGKRGFNPYFSGCFSLRSGIYASEQTCSSGFNPYFSGCFSLSATTIIMLATVGCFNPYFSGCFSLSQTGDIRYLDTLFLFQSLFFWMLHSKFFPFLHFLLFFRVSILIFLDASL